MNRTVISTCLLISVCLVAFAQTPSFTGRWVLTEDFFGTPRYMRLQLEQNASKLSGELNGDKLEGTVSGSSIQFIARSQDKDTFEVRGTFAHGILTGTMVATDAANRDHPYTFSLKQEPLRRWNTVRLSVTISRPQCSTGSSRRSTSPS